MNSIINQEISKYLENSLDNIDPLFSRMEKFAKEKNIPILEKSSAQFLEQLLYTSRPTNFLEIGTAIGYSTIRAAKVLGKEAKISTIELSKDNIELANSYFAEACVKDIINILEGNAIDILSTTQENYDFIFLDADKEDYFTLLDLSFNVLSINGIILVDNLLWKGFVVSDEIPPEYKKSTEFIRKFNAKFLNHPKLKSSILTIGDGLGLGVKLP